MDSQISENRIILSPKKRVSKPKDQKSLKKPMPAYMLFCIKKREQEKDKRLTGKQLGEMWNKLSELEKKPFIEQYNLEKKKYELLKAELEQKKSADDEDEKKKNHKVKAKTTKEQNDKNNNLPCNCGTCDDCVIRKKIKEEEEEELEDNKLAKKKAKRAVNDENDD